MVLPKKQAHNVDKISQSLKLSFLIPNSTNVSLKSTVTLILPLKKAHHVAEIEKLAQFNDNHKKKL